MSALHITNAVLVRPGVETFAGSILIKDDRVAAINPAPHELPEAYEHIDAKGGLLTPGLIDIHTHGVRNFLFERDPQELVDGVASLSRYGTTCVLPTLYSVLKANSLSQIERLARALPHADKVGAPGFHLEGPFLAIPGAGGATIPGDLVLLDELLSAGRGQVRAMSISPDCPNILPVIEVLHDQNIAAFLTHTRASAADTQAAIDAGARHATHFYNLFPAPPEIEPGVRPVGALEAVLVDPRCSVDFICDGVHVDPLAIRLAMLAKGWAGVVAITDSNVGAGAKEGVYPTPWGYSVKATQNNGVRVHDGTHPLNGQLAGSALTMDQAMANLLGWLDCAAHEIWAMGTCNPARLVGMADKGVLQPGADADVVLWSQPQGRLQAWRTWVRGVCVFNREDAAETKAWDHGKFVQV